MKRAIVLAALAACNADPGIVAPTLDHAEPPYAPLAGGSEIILYGSGFLADRAAPNRVIVGGREASLVRTIDDGHLGVVIPPGDAPGAVELVVLNRNGNTAARDILRYSAPPTITSVSPARVLYTSTTTRITLTGSGFLDDGAGTVDVLVDGWRVEDVAVTSDGELTFTAPPGRALVQPELTVLDARGTASTRRSFRYAPSDRPGLLLFPPFSSAFAVFVDPTTMQTVSIPWATNPSVRFTAVVRDDRGDYWGLDRSLRFGRIDMRTQTLEEPVSVGTNLPTIARVGADYVAIDRSNRRISRLDPATGALTPITPSNIPCCGSYGLASLGGTVYFTARENTAITINTVDLATGSLGTAVTLSGPAGLHIEEMRAFGGVLYATSRNGNFLTIDPVTGATTVLPISIGRANAMELFE